MKFYIPWQILDNGNHLDCVEFRDKEMAMQWHDEMLDRITYAKGVIEVEVKDGNVVTKEIMYGKD